MGIIILTLPQKSDLQNKDTASDDLLGGPSYLGFDSTLKADGL